MACLPLSAWTSEHDKASYAGPALTPTKSCNLMPAAVVRMRVVREPSSERVLDVMYTDLGTVGEDPDHVEPQGVEAWFSGVEVVLGDGAQGVLLAGGDCLERVSEARRAPQLDFDEDERVVLAHYQVDLPATRPVVALDERVAVLDQVAQREVLTPRPGRSVLQPPTPA